MEGGPDVISRALLLTIALLVGCDDAPPEAVASSSACAAHDPITGDSIGALRLGDSLDTVRATCSVIRDTVISEGPEGMPERIAVVAIDFATVEARVVDDRIDRIVVSDPLLRTNDSLGVSSTVADFRGLPVEVFTGEGGVFLVSEAHCGLSFQLGLADTTGTPTFDTLADSLRVVRVLLIGCDT